MGKRRKAFVRPYFFSNSRVAIAEIRPGCPPGWRWLRIIVRGFALSLIFVFSGCEPGMQKSERGLKDGCLLGESAMTFEIITWNLQDFPKAGHNTVEFVSSVIKRQNADLVALQELRDSLAFVDLLVNLPGWSGTYLPSSPYSLAFLFKDSEVRLDSGPVQLFTGDSYAFPRPVGVVSALYHTGYSILFFNLHLKCCGGGENLNRRIHASDKLKEYLDTNYPDKAFVVLGDFNDVLTAPLPGDNPFFNFMADSLNYRFADMAIASGPESDWSYPSVPSHIDHILISDELFDSAVEVGIIPLDLCEESYFSSISDHRPLMLRLSFGNP